MKVIVDDKIPYIKGEIEKIAEEVIYLPGGKIVSSDVTDADALVIRTRTQCNGELLQGSKVKFIATATIGYDHIDTEWCKKAGIYWVNAPGCNAGSVAQYIESVFALLKIQEGKDLTRFTLGIIGVGNVGRKVSKIAQRFGMKILLNDPPRQRSEGDASFNSLDEIAKEADIITFHTPLSKEGEDKTFHLGNELFFKNLLKKPIIINTSRGEVIDTFALLRAIQTEMIAETVLDVWENEPDINGELLTKTYVGTPHIAGYSADGKANATRMVLEELARFFNRKVTFCVSPPPPFQPVVSATTYEAACLKIYNPQTDSHRLKQNPAVFEKLRENYPLRREKEAYQLVITD